MPHMVAFIGPEAIEREQGHAFQARLGANESGFGPSPRVLDAMRQAVGQTWMYGDPENYDLRAAIARHHGLAIDQVVVGEGIDGLLGLAAKIAIEPGTVVVTSDGGYPTFNFHVLANGGRLVKVAYRDDKEDLEALLEAARREKAGVIYVANPDNPMGTVWDQKAVDDFLSQVPQTTLVLWDEAYADTADAGVIAPMVANPPANVIRFRTFSKAYGMAGARVGYGVGVSDVVSLLNRVRNDFGINRVGQIGALAALQDQDYLHDVTARIASARQRLSAIAKDNNFVALASATNFVAIDCGRDGAYAMAIMQEVLSRDVFIRKPSGAGIDRCIRVSVGPDEDLEMFAQALRDAIGAVG